MYRGSRVTLIVVMLFVSGVTNVDAARAQAEGVVRGQVMAAADRSAIGHASVTLSSPSESDQLRASTDATGRFTFGRVSPGEYVLTVSAEGKGYGAAGSIHARAA